MSTVVVVVIVIVVIAVIGVIGYVARAQARRRGLRQRFGPEYDRAVESHDNAKEAEQELLAREKRHDELDIRPLDRTARERHLGEWRQVQERFVDSPEIAVAEADRLLITVMGERGYPAEGYEQQVADLSVEHAGTIDRYREAHGISARAEAEKASTEDLRQAMVHYRALFKELLETGNDDATEDSRPEGARAADAGTDHTAAAGHAATTPRTDGTAPTATAESGTRTETEAQVAEETADENKAGARTTATAGRRTARRDSEG